MTPLGREVREYSHIRDKIREEMSSLKNLLEEIAPLIKEA